jgi:hypothetical protein
MERVYGYDPENKQHSPHRKSLNSPRPKKACRVLLIIFLTSKELSNTRRSTRQWQFLLRRFQAADGGHWHKPPDMWQNSWFLCHDNTPMHTSLVQQFLTSGNIAVIPHPIRLTSPPGTISYSQDDITAERVSFWHAELQEVINTLLRSSTRTWNGEHTGIVVYMPRGTTLKEMETGRYGKKLFLWSNLWKFCAAPCICSDRVVYSVMVWKERKLSFWYLEISWV